MAGAPLPSARRARYRLPMLVAACALLAAALWLSPVAGFETGAGLRLLYGLRGPAEPPRDVVIVGIDSTSSKALGLPDRPDRWPRSLHADLVSGLAASGATVIGFDLLFDRPRDDADDAALAAAFRRAGNVVLAEAVAREALTGPQGRVLATTDRRVRPLPLLADAALASAPVVLPKTPDGVFEFWTVIPAAGDQPSLPLLLAERMLLRPTPGRDPADLRARLAQPPRRVLNLYGPLGTVRTVRYAPALELVADPPAAARTFGGKAVLVGYSEFNQSKQADMYRSPFSTDDGVDISGVELAATALGNLLEDSWLRRPANGPTLLLLAAFAGLLALPWALLRPRAALLVTLALAAGYALAAHFAFTRAFLWLPVVIPLGFSPAIATGLGLASHYRAARHEQARLEKAIELGLPRRAVERLTAMLGDLSAGRTAFAVCLCSDIEGYTALSETLTPDATLRLLNAYFSRFIPVVERHGGYAVDMVGDCVMSVWVAGATPEAACRGACAAALELDRTMNAAAGPGALHTRFGLHCGQVYFGEIGPEGRRELRVVGDVVNTTSRVEGVNKYLGTMVIASGAVAAHAGPGHRRALGDFCLVGKARALELVQLTCEPLPAEADAQFAFGLDAFRAADFDRARRHFATALAAGDDGPSAFYLVQCDRQAHAARPPDWRGEVVLSGK